MYYYDKKFALKVMQWKEFCKLYMIDIKGSDWFYRKVLNYKKYKNVLHNQYRRIFLKDYKKSTVDEVLSELEFMKNGKTDL